MTAATPVAQAPQRQRRKKVLTLQTRLMVTVIGMVALILVAVALATSTILGQILMANLDTRVSATADQVRQSLSGPQSLTGGGDLAYDTLSSTGSHFSSGTLLIVQSQSGTDGAYITPGNEVVKLTSVQTMDIIHQLAVSTRSPQTNSGFYTVDVEGVGSFRVTGRVAQGQYGAVYPAIVGLPTSEVSTTIAQILTTVALVTAGGLLLLGVAIALIIRRGLRPLRAVADTAAHVAALPMSEGSVSISERVPADQADDRTEIGRVGAALNTLLDHVSTSLTARQRNEDLMRSFAGGSGMNLTPAMGAQAIATALGHKQTGPMSADGFSPRQYALIDLRTDLAAALQQFSEFADIDVDHVELELGAKASTALTRRGDHVVFTVDEATLDAVNLLAAPLFGAKAEQELKERTEAKATFIGAMMKVVDDGLSSGKALLLPEKTETPATPLTTSTKTPKLKRA